MHSYVGKNFILAKSGCYIMGVNEENGYYNSLISIKAWSHVGSYLAYLVPFH
jgi:isopropylmalate/homocitrate/citramalate synthase